MKKILLTVLIAMVCFNNLNGQEKRDKPTFSLKKSSLDRETENKLKKMFKEGSAPFEVYDLNVADFYNFIADTTKYVIDINLVTENNKYNLFLSRHSFKSKDFQAIKTISEKEQQNMSSIFEEIKCFKGTSNNSMKTYFTFVPNQGYLSAFMLDIKGRKKINIMSLNALFGNNKNPEYDNKVIIYNEEDVDFKKDIDSNQLCGTIDNLETINKTTNSSPDVEGGIDDSDACINKILKVSLTYSYHAYQEALSVSLVATMSNFVSQLNYLEAIYAYYFNLGIALNYTHMIGYEQGDPFLQDLNGDGNIVSFMLPYLMANAMFDFNQYWNTKPFLQSIKPNINFNVFVLSKFPPQSYFPGKNWGAAGYSVNDDIIHDGYGIAAISSVVNTNIPFPFANDQTGYVMAHELGHSFGCDHSDAINCGASQASIMCPPPVNLFAPYFGTTELNKINGVLTTPNWVNNHLNTRPVIGSGISRQEPWKITAEIDDDHRLETRWFGGCWFLNKDDIRMAGDFDGNGDDELLFISNKPSDPNFNGEWVVMLDYTCDNPTWHHYWDNGGNGKFNGWFIKNGDRYVVLDVNGDGKDELMMISSNNTAMDLYEFFPGLGWALKSYNGGSGQIAGWVLNSSDKMVVGDYNGDGKEDILFVSPGGWASIKIYNNISNTFSTLWHNGGNGKLLSNINGSANANLIYFPGYFTQSSRSEILFNKGTDVFLIKYNSSTQQFNQVWQNSGTTFGGFTMPFNFTQQKVFAINLDNDPLTEILVLDEPQLKVSTLSCYGNNFFENWNNQNNGFIYTKTNSFGNLESARMFIKNPLNQVLFNTNNGTAFFETVGSVWGGINDAFKRECKDYKVNYYFPKPLPHYSKNILSVEYGNIKNFFGFFGLNANTKIDFASSMIGSFLTGINFRIHPNTAETKNMEQEDKIIIYPNPIYDGQITVTWDDNKELKEVSLLVYGLDGKLVHTQNLTTNPSKVDLSRFASGTYLYHLTDTNGTKLYDGKLVISKK